MKKIFNLILFLLPMLISCGAELRDDPYMDTIQGNYPTAELVACGQRWHGLGICVVKKGTPLSAIAAKVQGYYNGTIHLSFSDPVRPAVDLTYQDSALVDIPLEAQATESMVIGVLVLPKYPNQADLPFQIYNFIGYLVIKVEDKYPVQAYVNRVKAGKDAEIQIQVKDTGPVDVFFTGCGGEYMSQGHPVVDGKVPIRLSAITQTVKKDRPCVISGAVRGVNKLEVTWLVDLYHENFLPLPLASTYLQGGRFYMTADKNAVSLVAFDNFYQIDYEGAWKWDPAQPHLARAFTVKGRSLLGIWSPTTQTWDWKN